MTTEEVVRMLENISSHAVHTFGEEPFTMSLDDGIAIKMAIKSLEAWEEVKQDLYKFASDSFDAECAECYRIALRCIEGHLKEVSE